MHYAEQNGYYKEMLGFMRSMFGSALKTNPSLRFAVLTGRLRIAKESIFTGLNNLKSYGISDRRFAETFGFTSEEVDALLAHAGMPDKKGIVKAWYDGYHFGGKTEMYCPWDVLQYLVDLLDDPGSTPKAYWNNTSGNAIVRTLLENAHSETRLKIENLIAGKALEERLEEDLTYDQIDKKERSLWSMLYLTGYLTKANEQPDNGNTALVIPNREVRMIFIDKILSWFEDSLKRRDLRPLEDALWQGDAAAIQKILKQILYGTISYFDNAENYYHGFLTGLLRGAGLNVRSNDEQGLGRPDIIIEDGLHERAIIIELKSASEYKDLDIKAEEGLRQIEDCNYAVGLPPQIRRVMK